MRHDTEASTSRQHDAEASTSHQHPRPEIEREDEQAAVRRRHTQLGPIAKDDEETDPEEDPDEED